MCLGIPAQIVRVEGDEAVIDVDGARRKVSSILAEDIKEGDYVIVHAGFIIKKIDPDMAEYTLQMIRRL